MEKFQALDNTKGKEMKALYIQASPLEKDKSAFIAYSRGGEYGKGDERDPFDFQKPYLEAVLGLIGISDIRSVVVQPTLGGDPEVARQKLDESLEEARQAASDFA